jgi:uncharacterized tellurite resistance protein B-like protein
MSVFDWLRRARPASGGPHGDTETVRRIVGELDRMEPAEARHLATFAYVLSRAAAADLHVSEVETARMTEIVRRVGRLSEPQALLVVEMAKSQSRLFGGTEDFLVTREFRDIATDAQRRDLLDCLFAVAAADRQLSGEEEAQIWQIASELGFSHADYVAARMAYSDVRTVFRKPQ